MQTYTNQTFNSDFGAVVYDSWLPHASERRGVVIQIAHGMIEHRGRYGWLCESLARAGYVVLIHDHRGHGDSIAAQGAAGGVWRGEMGEQGFERAVADMRTLREIAGNAFGGHQFVLLGHSMGSLLARRFLQLYESQLDGLILCGTPSPHPLVGVGASGLRLLHKLGMVTTPKIGETLSFNRKFYFYCKKHGISPVGYWACSDEAVVKAFLTDTKCQFRFTTNSLANLLAGMQRVFSAYPRPPQNPALPILFLSGEQDACGDFGQGVMRACQHLKSQGYQQVAARLYPNARHEIFNEPCKHTALADTLRWLAENRL